MIHPQKGSRWAFTQPPLTTRRSVLTALRRLFLLCRGGCSALRSPQHFCPQSYKDIEAAVIVYPHASSYPARGIEYSLSWKYCSCRKGCADDRTCTVTCVIAGVAFLFHRDFIVYTKLDDRRLGCDWETCKQPTVTAPPSTGTYSRKSVTLHESWMCPSFIKGKRQCNWMLVMKRRWQFATHLEAKITDWIISPDWFYSANNFTETDQHQWEKNRTGTENKRKRDKGAVFMCSDTKSTMRQYLISKKAHN